MIPSIILGSTGISASRLGLGTVKFGRNTGVKYPKDFILPDDKNILDLLNLALEYNINLLDTAPAYGSSEERLGKLLHGSRQKWIIISKVGEEFNNNVSTFSFTAASIKSSIERSLRRLHTDYIDIILVHSDGNDAAIINNSPVFAILADYKQKGLIRAFGMSTKTVEGGILALTQADVVMAQYNPVYRDEEPVLDYAAQHNKGILIKKALASGHLQKIANNNPITASFNFILQHKAPSSIIIGTINKAHLKENIIAFTAASTGIAT